MWIKVHGGPVPLWVRLHECRLPEGDLAFVNEPAIGRAAITAAAQGLITAFPDMVWFSE